jgi:hypothetical protein
VTPAEIIASILIEGTDFSFDEMSIFCVKATIMLPEEYLE